MGLAPGATTASAARALAYELRHSGDWVVQRWREALANGPAETEAGAREAAAVGRALVEGLADSIGSGLRSGLAPAAVAAAEQYAVRRRSRRASLAELVAELCSVRDPLLDLCRERRLEMDGPARTLLHRAVDFAVAAASEGYLAAERAAQEAERQKLQRQCQEAAAGRQQVLRIVSHDLRNPLNTISIAAQLLKEGEAPRETAAKGLAAITRAVTRMNRMISDLVDVYSMQTGGLALQFVRLDPVALLDEVIDLFAAQAATRGLALGKEAPATASAIRADRQRLVQALSNLVSNAVEVTTAGTVRVCLEDAGREVVFSVIDEGPGVRPEAREHIFQRYWRGDRTPYRGAGLGLAIVRGIVEGHGGRVWLDGEAGRGAAFRFAIPVEPEAEGS